MKKYDPDLIQQVADQVYSSAAGIVNLSIILGALVGASAGYGLLQEAIGALLGGLIGGGFGYALGAERALKLKFEVQLALCLAEIEKNTRQQSVVTATTARGSLESPNSAVPSEQKPVTSITLVTCSACSKQVNTSAAACTHCGALLRK